MPNGEAKTGGVHSRRPLRRRRRPWAGAITIVITIVVVVTVLAFLVSRIQPGASPVLPKAFGQDGKCYYVHSPSEVTRLKHAGHCPASSVPARAPNSWLFLYYPFYTSRYYTSNYVSSDDEAAYHSYLSGFDSEYATEIGQDAPAATYVTSSGADETGAEAGVGAEGTTLGSDDGSGDVGSGGGGSGGGGGGEDDGGGVGGGDGGGE